MASGPFNGQKKETKKEKRSKEDGDCKNMEIKAFAVRMRLSLRPRVGNEWGARRLRR